MPRFVIEGDEPQSRFVIEGAPSADPKIGQPEELTFAEKYVAPILDRVKLPAWMDNMRGNTAGGVMQGMADPAVGAVQLATEAALPDVIPGARFAKDYLNRRISEQNKQYEAARASAGRDGVDASRIAGNVLSPTNLVLAGAGPAVEATTAGRVAFGAKIGGLGAAAEPVYNAENGGYAGKKAGQLVAGVATGALLTPILGKVGDAVVRRFAQESPQVLAARSAQQTDVAINDALQELGQTIHDIPPAQLQALRDKVGAALAGGEQRDAAALTRQADFEALGMKPTLGQVTREPMQFAREQNLRGVEGIGEPLSARLATQGRQLQERLAAPAEGARDAYNAGTAFNESLGAIDDKLRGHVSGLYREARASVGKDLDVPLQGLAQDYARILGDFGDNVPGAIRSKLSALGLDPASPSNQRKIFTLEDANGLMQVINKNDPRHTNPPMSKALGELRDAIRGAVTSADASGGPFAPAVKAASERFMLHDAVPALKAAAEGSIAPDDFVRRFIVNGKTDEVKGLAQVLKQADPAAHQEARAQIADVLKRAAFGENPAGDAPFASARYMQAVRKLGPDKLGAFFSAQEVADIMRVGRVGAYIKQAPNASAVSSSNSNIGLLNVLARVPGLSGAAGVANRVASTVQNNATVKNALAAHVPTTQAPLSEMQRNYLAYLLAGGAVGAGGLAAGPVGK